MQAAEQPTGQVVRGVDYHHLQILASYCKETLSLHNA